MGSRLADRAASVVERRVPRRGVLTRAAVAASALAVAPLRYLLRSLAAGDVITTTCGDCPPGSLCCAGYTAFCCQLPGGSNTRCPVNSFVGGWWKCTNYTGSGLCNQLNVRYYLDCNELPGHTCTDHCASDNCGYRQTCRYIFRYGQCNTQIKGVTKVVCRLITCVPPWQIDCLNCNSTPYASDNNTCGHEASCF